MLNAQKAKITLWTKALCCFFACVIIFSCYSKLVRKNISLILVHSFYRAKAGPK